jgi:urea transporter
LWAQTKIDEKLMANFAPLLKLADLNFSDDDNEENETDDGDDEKDEQNDDDDDDDEEDIERGYVKEDKRRDLLRRRRPNSARVVQQIEDDLTSTSDDDSERKPYTVPPVVSYQNWGRRDRLIGDTKVKRVQRKRIGRDAELHPRLATRSAADRRRHRLARRFSTSLRNMTSPRHMRVHIDGALTARDLRREQRGTPADTLEARLATDKRPWVRALGALYGAVGGTMSLQHAAAVDRRARAGVRLDWPVYCAWTVLMFVFDCLRGVSQVCFVNNPVSGALIVTALFVGDAWLALNALVGCGVATLFAVVMAFDRLSVRAGLFGYNGTLCGAALSVFLLDRWSPLTLLASATAGMLSALVMLATGNALIPVLRVPPLTFPFNWTTLAALMVAFSSPYFATNEAALPAALLPVQIDGSAVSHAVSTSLLVDGFFKGFSQIYLVESVASGALMLAAIFVASPISAAAASLGSLVGIGTSYAIGADASLVANGFVSFNPILSAIGVGGFFYVLSWRSALLALLCAVFTSLAFFGVGAACRVFGMPAFTLPFCIVTFAFLLVQGSLPGVTPVALTALTTPESHLYTFHRRQTHTAGSESRVSASIAAFRDQL